MSIVYIGGVTSAGTLISLSVKISPIDGIVGCDNKLYSEDRETLEAALRFTYSTILKTKGLV
jgi:hypothetical protein